MCELCDRPDLTMEDDLEHVRDLLTRERFVLRSVMGSVTQAELTYTVGLTAHGLPELVVLGVRPANAQALLRQWGTTCSTRAPSCRGRRCAPARS